MLTPQERANGVFHVGYEWWMFRASLALVQSLPKEDDPLRNALIESMVMHGRALTEFFYFKKNEKYPDDINAQDLGMSCPSLPSELKKWWENAGNRVAHISKKRFGAWIDWDGRAPFNILGERIAELRKACSKEIGADWIGDWPTESKHLPKVPGYKFPPRGGSDGPVGATGPAGP
jgi:hypothetical protein